MVEREVKLDVPLDFVLPSLDGVARLRPDPPSRRVQESTYWDTADNRLLVHGVGLRWRTDSGWTCKSDAGGPEGDLLAREERTVPGTPAVPPRELTQPLEAMLAGLRLASTVRIRTQRTATELRSSDGTARLELVDDLVRVLDGPLEGHVWRELEIELRDRLTPSQGGHPRAGSAGEEAMLAALLARLREAGAGRVVRVAKQLRALGVNREIAPGSLDAHQVAGRLAEQLGAGATRAAGGVVIRDGPGNESRELVVVHRPRHDDWCLPKGKQDPGETLPSTAVREVEEETGLLCIVETALGCISHPLDDGATKTVWWWRMRAVDGELRTSEETDRAVWLTVEAAQRTLSHAGERALVSRLG